ncbi:Uncharacterized protein PRO82_000949 [Candidatus Protochlamydia amoebophila]|uniref:hypothetical protein n=1 Tax=Candidatus Protochlamydia amoebophila TaxID=362787 RepID=UPI001BC9A41B|nr:hypothetical protein [Candidatus Protochlamydia amoebophila]MBS4163646.1 Uncharacterized protein [Candidatus Protochlamydia amoebophila]
MPPSGLNPNSQTRPTFTSQEISDQPNLDIPEVTVDNPQQSISTEVVDNSVSMQANHNASLLEHLTSTKLHQEMDQQRAIVPLQGQVNTKPPMSYVALRQETDPAVFHDAITKANAGPTVYIYSIEEYAEMTMFLSTDKSFGVAVKLNGDIVSVFKDAKKAPRGVVDILIPKALENEGTHLDCFNMPSLPLPLMYAKHGLVPVAKVAFDPKEKPEGWDVDKYGKPDVIFMAYNPAKPYPTDARERLPLINADINKLEAVDYDSAIKIQEEKVKEFHSYRG